MERKLQSSAVGVRMSLTEKEVRCLYGKYDIISCSRDFNDSTGTNCGGLMYVFSWRIHDNSSLVLYSTMLVASNYNHSTPYGQVYRLHNNKSVDLAMSLMSIT